MSKSQETGIQRRHEGEQRHHVARQLATVAVAVTLAAIGPGIGVADAYNMTRCPPCGTN